MRPSKYDNLRWCDRLKSSIVYNQVEAFGKKFRKKKDHENQIINANAQQREIDAFYKVGWEYEHAHSSYSTDISDPIYIQQKPDQAKDEDLTQFYNTCKNGIQRLKCQHQDETVFRTQARWSRPICSISKEDWQSDKYSILQKKMYQNVICAKETYRNFIVNFERFVHSMISNIENDIDIEGQSEYSKVLQIYQIISGWLQYYKGGDEQDTFETQQWLQQQSDEVISIHHYISNFISIGEEVRNEKRSAVFNIQPMIDALTLIIHPALLGLFGLYRKEQIIWSNQYQHNVLNIYFNRKIESGSLLEDVKHGEISRTVFLNLDGYESQFNIEFAKNMSNHLLYISFPIFNKPAQPQHSPFNTRFLKKLLFNHCRQLYELHNDQNQTIKTSPQIEDMEYNQILKQLHRNFNQQDYFHQCEKLYSNKNIAQGNNNIYILPVIFPYLQEEFKNLFIGGHGEGSCQLWVSSFVWFMMDSFIMADIARYNPDRIVVSYSGLLNISEQHFIRIMQQLATISKRRIIFCPNLTTKFTQKLKQDYNYDNYVTISQQFLTSEVLMPKLSQFLKISSGTYNLNPPPLTQNILQKYKQLKLNNYIKGLLTALSNKQFAHMKNRISNMLLRVDGIVMNRAVKDVELELSASIPAFYKKLFAYIRTILLYPYCQAKYEKGVGEQVLKIKKVLDKIGRVEDRQAFVADMIRGLELAIAQQKYSNYAYVYFKCKMDKVEYAQLKQQISQTNTTTKQPAKRTQNNLQGLYTLQLKQTTPKKQKLCLPIYSTTELLYRQNQTYKMRRTGKKTANIMLMNNLEQNEYRCYAGLVNLIQLHETDRNKQKIPMQRVEMYQVVFNGMGEVGGWKVRGHWNYAETNRYYILYWPTLCDLLELKLKQINDDINEPTILNQIYICQIPTTKQHKLIFNPANPTNQDTIPRKHCNSLSLDQQDKIFILGGFYQKQHNYLSLQTQITGLDLSHYNDTNLKCIITNEKGTLYTDIKHKNKTNSYVRARAEYQIFQLEEVCDIDIDEDVDMDMGQHMGEHMGGDVGEREANQRVKRFVMIGGFGQDFVRPYSLLSCNYYEIAVDKQQRKIVSISRKQVYQKILTCNIRGYIKNNGYTERLAYYDRNILKSNEALSKDDYIAHRSVYSLQRQLSHGSVRYELHSKLKYLFGFNPYNQYKLAYVKLAAKLGQRVDAQTNESSEFLLMISPQGNNYLTIWKSKNDEQNVQIYLQKMQSKSKYQKVALTHGSIISIDLKFQHIYALIKHQLYTSGKYVLAESEIVSEQSEILLKVVKEFSHHLQQYWLFTPRPTEVLLLHGISFLNVNVQDFSYRISKKQGSKQEPIKKIAFPDRIDPEMYRKCLTIMTKTQDNETKTPQILSTNLLFRLSEDPTLTMSQHKLKMSSHNPNFTWERISRSRIQLWEQNCKKPTTIKKILQIRQIDQQAQHQYNLPLVTNASILNEISKSLQPIFLFRFHGACRKDYVWIVNSCSLAVPQQELKFVVFGSGNQDVKTLWELATPLKFHTKTINKYKDMEML